MRRAAALFSLATLFSAICAADDADLLTRARAQISKVLERVPRYACSLAISRDYYQPTFTRPPDTCQELFDRKTRSIYRLDRYSADRLKLEVTVADDREVFAWPGAGAFDDSGLVSMLWEGPLGTGTFAGFLSNIFDGKAAEITFTGVRDRQGRALAWYDYRISLARTNHRFRAGKEWIPVAYDGTFALDPENANLVVLTFRVEHPPAASRTCLTTGVLNYSVVKLGGSDFLLPAKASQRFIGITGQEAENTVQYSACHEFLAESSVSFGPQPDFARKPNPAGIARLAAPENRPVNLELAAPIDTATASAGDAFTARVVQAIRDARGNVLVPAGTLVRGRLTRVERGYGINLTTVVFQPLSVPGPGGSIPIVLLPRTRRQPIWATTFFGGRPLRWRAASEAEILFPSERELGVYHFRGTDIVIPARFRTEWITGKP